MWYCLQIFSFISAPASQLALLSGRMMQLMANHPTAGSAVRFRHAYFKLPVWLTVPAFFSTLTCFICCPIICGHFLLCKVQLGRSYRCCLFKMIHFPHGWQQTQWHSTWPICSLSSNFVHHWESDSLFPHNRPIDEQPVFCFFVFFWLQCHIHWFLYHIHSDQCLLPVQVIGASYFKVTTKLC